MRFLNSLDFDRTSFWLGFLAGFLFLWLLGRLRPIFSRLLVSMRESLRESRLRLTAGADIRLRNEALRRAQALHLAAPLFSLDEILILPKLLAPPPPVLPGEAAPEVDITHTVMPYLPDWSELPGRYRAPTLTLAEAMQGGTSLVVIGRPGSGKSVALAHLASQLARREPLPGEIEKLTPLFLQATDLSLPPENPEILLDALLAALGQTGAAATKARVAEYIHGALLNERALLILDGLDDLPPAAVDEICAYLAKLKEQYPALRVVASASLEYYDGLTRLGCAPLAMASWDRAERAAFVQRWSQVWTATIQKPAPTTTEPDLINAWLMGESAPATPFEVTLKTWAVYAGDQIGSTFNHAIEAYLRRMVFNKNMQPAPEARPVMEQIALRMTLVGKATLTRTELGVPTPGAVAPAQEESPEIHEEPPPAFSLEGKINAEPVLPLLLENGLLVTQTGGKLKFNHLIPCAYLAANAINELVGVDGIFSGVEWTAKPGWDLRTSAMGFALALGNPLTRVIEKHFNQDQAPLHQHLFTLARWLPLASANATWRSALLRRLAAILQDENLPMGLRARAAAAIATSTASGIGTLLHQLSISSNLEQRQLAALAAGLYFDDKIAADKAVADRLIADISDLLSDSQLNVQRAACLGLVAMGNRPALEAVADALLVPNDELRKSAAEALANHPEEGYPTLREGATIDDLLVRRAVIFGLVRVREAWAVELLAKIQIEEEEWLVKNAATHALETMKLPNPYLPQPLPPLTETAWLIAYAGETGIGVSPGRPATELLLRALREGNADQALAALDYLRQYGDDLAIPSIYQVMLNNRGEVQEASFNTLWHMAAAGVKLPSPESVMASA
jgi:HEAT repeat protein